MELRRRARIVGRPLRRRKSEALKNKLDAGIAGDPLDAGQVSIRFSPVA